MMTGGLGNLLKRRFWLIWPGMSSSMYFLEFIDRNSPKGSHSLCISTTKFLTCVKTFSL